VPKLKRVKRPTDNRMSKGRRLSYEVQPKLLHFMFPEIPERPIVLAELFASVFGQRVAVAAADDAQQANGHGGAPADAQVAAAKSSSVATTVPTAAAPQHELAAAPELVGGAGSLFA